MFILFFLYFTWWILFSACTRGLQARDVKVSVYLQGTYKQRAWPNPIIISKSWVTISESLATFYKVPKYKYVFFNTMFENLKNILYEKKEETVCLFVNFPVDGGFLWFGFFFKSYFMFDWTWVLKSRHQRLCHSSGWRPVFPGRIYEAVLSVIPNSV